MHSSWVSGSSWDHSSAWQASSRTHGSTPPRCSAALLASRCAQRGAHCSEHAAPRKARSSAQELGPCSAGRGSLSAGGRVLAAGRSACRRGRLSVGAMRACLGVYARSLLLSTCGSVWDVQHWRLGAGGALRLTRIAERAVVLRQRCAWATQLHSFGAQFCSYTVLLTKMEPGSVFHSVGTKRTGASAFC